MGIYNDGIIYGVSWIIYDETDEIVNQFEKHYDTKITIEQLAEIKIEYDKLSELQKTIMCVRFYTCCTDTYGPESYMHWWTADIERLEELFANGDASI